jgi:hypothetical protein
MFLKTVPPLYNVTELRVPVYTYWGTNDWLADGEDFDWLKTQLSTLKGNKTLEGYSHLDFIWGMDVGKRVYSNIIEIAKQPDHVQHDRTTD